MPPPINFNGINLYTFETNEIDAHYAFTKYITFCEDRNDCSANLVNLGPKCSLEDCIQALELSNIISFHTIGKTTHIKKPFVLYQSSNGEYECFNEGEYKKTNFSHKKLDTCVCNIWFFKNMAVEMQLAVLCRYINLTAEQLFRAYGCGFGSSLSRLLYYYAEEAYNKDTIIFDVQNILNNPQLKVDSKKS